MPTPENDRSMPWDDDAQQSLVEMVPEPFRDMARQKVEEIARERGADRVTLNEVSIAKARYLSGNL